MALNLTKRELMAMEMMESLIKSTTYYDKEVGRISPTTLAMEAVELADALCTELDKNKAGSILILNSENEQVPVSPEIIKEAKRLNDDGKASEAADYLVTQCGCSKKVATEFIETHCK